MHVVRLFLCAEIRNIFVRKPDVVHKVMMTCKVYFCVNHAEHEEKVPSPWLWLVSQLGLSTLVGCIIKNIPRHAHFFYIIIIGSSWIVNVKF